MDVTLNSKSFLGWWNYKLIHHSSAWISCSHEGFTMPYGSCWAGQLEVHTYTDLISYSHEMFCIPSGKFTQIPTSYQFFCSINVLHFVQTSMGRSRHHCIITWTLPCHYASLAHWSHDSTVQFVGHITALPKSSKCHACPTEKKDWFFSSNTAG